MTKSAQLLATSAAVLFASGASAVPIGYVECVVDSDPLTITPPGCLYASPASATHGINFDRNLDWSRAIHQGFINVQMQQGGIFQGGNIDTFSSTVTITVTGKGELAGFQRTISVNADCEAHSGPWNPKDPFISFPTEMMRIEGELVGDRDFKSLRIVAGSANGLPSRGQVTAVDQGDGTHVVDSMFNIGFHIEYVGARGGALEGLSGSFEGVATMKAFGSIAIFADGFESGATSEWSETVPLLRPGRVGTLPPSPGRASQGRSMPSGLVGMGWSNRGRVAAGYWNVGSSRPR